MNLKVLLVDDDDVFIFLHNRFLTKNGVSTKPLSFENGKEALDYLNSERNSNQRYLIFLDIHMPVMNGWQFLDSIQHTTYEKNVLIAIVTSSINSEAHSKAKQYSQVMGYFEKPLTEKSLKQITQLSRISTYLNS